MANLQDILIDANSYLDLSAELPTGDELTTRVNYANQAVKDAAATGKLREFSSVYYVTPSLATVPLPSNFREFEQSPVQLTSDGLYDEFQVLNPGDIFSKDGSSKYCYVLGNPASGYFAIFNNLTAGATLTVNYQRYPSLMATYSDMCELSDAQFVVSKIESYVLQARSDDRFPIVEADAQRRLQNMMGRNDIPVTNETTKRTTAIYNAGYGN